MKWKKFIENLKTQTSRPFFGFFRKRALKAINLENSLAQITRNKKQMGTWLQVADTDKKYANIAVSNGYLIMSWDQPQTNQYAGTYGYSTWKEYPSIRRMNPPPDGVNAADIDSSFKNSVLHLQVALRDMFSASFGCVAVV